MKRFDEILNFLLRTVRGRVVLILSTLFSVMMLGGCFVPSVCGCAFTQCGCDMCADICYDCDTSCSCNDEGCTLANCLCGNGCTTDCGACGYVVCGGCNETCFECSDDASCNFFNCACYEGDSPESGRNETVSYRINYTANYYGSDGKLIGTATQSFYESDSVWHQFESCCSSDDLDADPPSSMTQSVHISDSINLPGGSSYWHIVFINLNGTRLDGTTFKLDAGKWEQDGNHFTSNSGTVVDIFVEERMVGETVNFVFTCPQIDGFNDITVPAIVGATAPSMPSDPSFPPFKFLGWTVGNDGESEPFAFKPGVFHLYDYGLSSNETTVIVNGTFEIKQFEGHVYRVTDENTPISLDGTLYYDLGIELSTAIHFVESSEYTKGDVTYKLGEDTEKEEFVGWFYDAECTHPVNGSDVFNTTLMPDFTFKLYAKYHKTVLDPVTVYLHNVGGPNDNQVTEVTCNERDVINLEWLDEKVTERTLGRFTADTWYSDSAHSKPVIESVTLKTDGTYHFYLDWEEKTTFRVSYYYNYSLYKSTSNPSPSITDTKYTLLDYHKDLILPTDKPDAGGTPGAVYIRNNYTFEGWRLVNPDKSLSNTVFTDKIPKETYERDLVLVAMYSHTLYFLPADGVTIPGAAETQKVYYGFTGNDLSANILPVPRSQTAGSAFSGWSLDTEGTRIITDSTGKITDSFEVVPDDEITYIFDVWGRATHTITFMDGATKVEEKTVPFGSRITPPAAPTKTGYTFVAWKTAAGVELKTDTTVSGNETYYAAYEVNKYTITLNANGGTINGKPADTKQITYGTGEGTELGVPTLEGKRFLGWYDAAEGGNRVTLPNGKLSENYTEVTDITLYAHWA